MDRSEFDKLQRQMGDIPVKVVRNIIFALVVIGVVLVAAFTSVYQVEAQDTGVVLRFGKYLKDSEPGLHWKLPFWIDRVEHVSTKLIKKADFGTEVGSSQGEVSLMVTGDLNVVYVPWTVQYRVKDAYKFLYKVRNADETLRDVAESAMRLVIGDYSITDILTGRRFEVEQEARGNIQALLDEYETGIEITQISLQNVTPPAVVKASFDAVTAAQQEMETTVNEARQEYFKITTEARGEAKKIVSFAEGYKFERVREAEGDAARFNSLLKEYQLAPEVTRTRIYLETLGEVLPTLSHVYVLDENGQGPLQVLDLQKAGAATRSVRRERPSGSASDASAGRRGRTSDRGRVGTNAKVDSVDSQRRTRPTGQTQSGRRER